MLTNHSPLSAVFFGLSIHDILSSLFILLQRRIVAGGTALYATSVLTSTFLISFLCLQTAALHFNNKSDFSNQKSFEVYGALTGMNYFFDYLTSLGIWTMALIRLRVFHGSNSSTFRWMCTLAAILFIVKGIADGFGVYIGFVEIPKTFNATPIELISIWQMNLTFDALSHVLEAVFLFLTSYYFLVSISVAIGVDSNQFLYKILIDYEGYRFIVIVLLNLIMSAFSIHDAVLPANYITRIGFYIRSWAFAMEFHTFLHTSYVIPRQVILGENLEKLGSTSN